MRSRIPVLLAVAALSAACIDPLETSNGRFGAITAAAFDGGAANYTMRPEAAFYGETDLSYEPFTSDTCLLAQFFPNSTTINGSLRFLDAGDRLLTSVSGRVDTLVPVSNIGLRIYQSPNAGGIPYTPGDTLTITIPGAAFPASAISVRTAEPFTHSAVGVPVADEPLSLTWTPATVAGSQMTFSLRYANSFSTTGLNEQVFCSFVDDGAATVPAAILGGWINALNAQRQTKATRIRSREVTVDARTRLSLLSTFSQPINTTVQ